MQDSKRLDKDIIEAGRSGGHSCRDKFESRINRGNLQHIHEDMLVERERMFMDYNRDGRSYQDRLGPLRKYLRSHVGQPWDKVYSKLCRAYDDRTTSGRHLIRDHVDSEVYTWAEWCNRFYKFYYPWREEFYVNQHGILSVAQSAPVIRRPKTREDIKSRVDENGYLELTSDTTPAFFRYLNGCWFSVDRIVHKIRFEEPDYSSYLKIDDEWVITRKRIAFVDKIEYINQRQLNKKELKKYGLKNDPTFSDH